MMGKLLVVRHWAGKLVSHWPGASKFTIGAGVGVIGSLLGQANCSMVIGVEYGASRLITRAKVVTEESMLAIGQMVLWGKWVGHWTETGTRIGK